MPQDAYQASAPIKAQEIASNQQKADDLIHQHKTFSRAVAHLNKQTERDMTPKTDWAPAGSYVAP